MISEFDIVLYSRQKLLLLNMYCESFFCPPLILQGGSTTRTDLRPEITVKVTQVLYEEVEIEVT